MNSYLKIVAEFEKRVGLPKGFFDSLLSENDWSFVIKTHALVEACLVNAICSKLGRSELESVVARLETANKQSGKLAFAEKLGIVNRTQRRFIVALSELRNQLVHNARATGFTFEEYWAGLSEDRHFQICVALAMAEEPYRPAEPNEIKLISLVNEVPKVGIGFATALVLTDLYSHALEGDLDVAVRDFGSSLMAHVSSAYCEAKNAL